MSRAHRGFILLFGTRAIISTDSEVPAVRTVCPSCGQQADMIGRKFRTWFTLFFIPVFPVSGAQKLTECSHCHAKFRVDARELGRHVAAAERDQSQRAIGLYNSLRASPANSVTLNELMTMYAQMNEYDQAIGAAGQFPEALHNSEQCMTTLGRVYLARNENGESVKWFDAAVARNPALGEAQYYKAVAHLTSLPPDHEKAIAAARAARSAGFPKADELLKEAESRARG